MISITTISVCGALGVSGLALLVRGLRGRQLETPPRCPKCDYDLSELPTLKCPECGWVIDPYRIRRSRRQRIGKAIAWGCVLLTIGAPLAWLDVPGRVVAEVRRGAWWEYAPVGFLIGRAEAGSDTCLRELTRRLRLNEFSGDGKRRLVDAGLRVQEAVTPPDNAQSWFDLAGELESHSHMTKAELARYYLALTDIAFEVRPVVRAGDPLPARLTFRPRAPRCDSYFASIGRGTIRIDGSETPAFCAPVAKFFRGNASERWGEYQLETKDLAPGFHLVECEVPFQLYRYQPRDFDSEHPLVERTIKRTVTVKVLAAGAADSVTLVIDPKVTGAVGQAITATLQFTGETSPRGLDIYELQLDLVGPLPCDLACQVSISSEASVPVETITAGRSTPPGATLFTGRFETTPFRYKRLLWLDPSVEAARRSVDAIAILGEPLSVELKKSMSSSEYVWNVP